MSVGIGFMVLAFTWDNTEIIHVLVWLTALQATEPSGPRETAEIHY